MHFPVKNEGYGRDIYRECDRGKRAICAGLVRIGLNCFHIRIGQPEMVADFVDQDMA
jgi:hypothetical protein